MAMTMDSQRFEVVEYIKKLRNAGASQELAEVQAQEMEHALANIVKQAKQEFRDALDSKELANKGDISLVRSEIRESELRLQKEIKNLEIKLLTLYGGGFFVLLGVLAKGFHWL